MHRNLRIASLAAALAVAFPPGPAEAASGIKVTVAEIRGGALVITGRANAKAGSSIVIDGTEYKAKVRATRKFSFRIPDWRPDDCKATLTAGNKSQPILIGNCAPKGEAGAPGAAGAPGQNGVVQKEVINFLAGVPDLPPGNDWVLLGSTNASVSRYFDGTELLQYSIQFSGTTLSPGFASLKYGYCRYSDPDPELIYIKTITFAQGEGFNLTAAGAVQPPEGNGTYGLCVGNTGANVVDFDAAAGSIIILK